MKAFHWVPFAFCAFLSALVSVLSKTFSVRCVDARLLLFPPDVLLFRRRSDRSDAKGDSRVAERTCRFASELWQVTNRENYEGASMCSTAALSICDWINHGPRATSPQNQNEYSA